MSLQSLIREGNYATAQEAFETITTQSIEVRDDQLYTWAGVALLAGATGAESLRVALDQNGLGWVVHQLGGSGIQLSNELVQQVLLGFAQANVAGCDVLAAQGVHDEAPWQVDGIANEPTLEQVTEAFAAELRYRAYQSILSRASAAVEAAGEAYRSPTPTAEEIVLEGEEAFEVA